jgi:O-antigen ligase
MLSVIYGIATGALTADPSAVAPAQGRFSGGAGDPNFFAAAIVAGIMLAMVLFVTARRGGERSLAAGCVGLLALALAASQSRGGMIAGVVLVLAALVLFKRQRAWVLAFVAVVAAVIAAWFSVSPSAWERIQDVDNGGSGRTDLWTLSWRAFEDNPITGVGLFNYSAAAPDYTDESGALSRIDLLMRHEHEVVHNAYLQVLSDTGVVGLVLFLTVIGASVAAAVRAARRFEALGDRAMETISRGVVAATVGVLAASFFISNEVDKRLWVLLAVGPALLAVASRQAGPGSLRPAAQRPVTSLAARSARDTLSANRRRSSPL